ncbi:palmitoyltransferase ZDHHC2-like [Watersipora subatra]|uniref:palmitoyltransferase ZDHHC2-like n=1 Tax=Watersipora subatra TaxID=2589382 RepID=UPI00355B2296
MVSALDCCFKTTRWFPVVFIVAVIGWSYYAYVVQLIALTIAEESMAEKVILGLLYHPILFMFLWAYYKIVYTEPKGPPMQFYLTTDQITPLLQAESDDDREKGAELLEQYVKPLPVCSRTFSQGVRYCELCKCLKPDRAHHCSICKKCVLKMDHHCPWVNNCVSFINYKFFFLFLFYAEIYCLFVAFTDLKYFIALWASRRGPSLDMNFHVLFLFIVAIMFAFSVFGLLSYHIYLILRNQSTLESFRPPVLKNLGPDKHVFDLGKKRNWREVFGDNPKLWFLPVVSCKGDGVTYPSRYDHQIPSYNSLENGRNTLVP